MSEIIESSATFTAFAGDKQLVSGRLPEVAIATKRAHDDGVQNILIFNDQTSSEIDVDWRGTPEDVQLRYRANLAEEARGPGRPKLGVVSREVTLLPRHWEWLNSQPGGASVALRKLVELAKRESVDKDEKRKSQEAAYRFMSAMAGNLVDFEEASRALFAGDKIKFEVNIAQWPEDIRKHLLRISTHAFIESNLESK